MNREQNNHQARMCIKFMSGNHAEVVDGIQVKPGRLADLIIERCNSGQSAGKMLSPVGAPKRFANHGQEFC